jgi:hypothetical protein
MMLYHKSTMSYKCIMKQCCAALHSARTHAAMLATRGLKPSTHVPSPLTWLCSR